MDWKYSLLVLFERFVWVNKNSIMLLKYYIRNQERRFKIMDTKVMDIEELYWTLITFESLEDASIITAIFFKEDENCYYLSSMKTVEFADKKLDEKLRDNTSALRKKGLVYYGYCTGKVCSIREPLNSKLSAFNIFNAPGLNIFSYDEVLYNVMSIEKQRELFNNLPRDMKRAVGKKGTFLILYDSMCDECLYLELMKREELVDIMNDYPELRFVGWFEDRKELLSITLVYYYYESIGKWLEEGINSGEIKLDFLEEKKDFIIWNFGYEKDEDKKCRIWNTDGEFLSGRFNELFPSD